MDVYQYLEEEVRKKGKLKFDATDDASEIVFRISPSNLEHQEEVEEFILSWIFPTLSEKFEVSPLFPQAGAIYFNEQNELVCNLKLEASTSYSWYAEGTYDKDLINLLNDILTEFIEIHEEDIASTYLDISQNNKHKTTNISTHENDVNSNLCELVGEKIEAWIRKTTEPMPNRYYIEYYNGNLHREFMWDITVPVPRKLIKN